MIQPINLKPFLEQYQKLYLENMALRVVLNKREDWDDEQVNVEKARLAPRVEATFALLYKLLDNPSALAAAFAKLPS